MKHRILTIEVHIVDEDKAVWIWENHMGKDTYNGVFVKKIQEGELPDYEDTCDE